MTLLSAFIDSCEAHLADSGNAIWLAVDIEQWSRDAIADYSLHFPRTLSQTINGADAYEYSLVAGFLDAVSVEYPDGQDPPEFLKWKDHLDNDFYGSAGYYDIIRRSSATVSTLITSKNYGAGDDIILTYLSLHDNTIATNAALTVSDDHLHIIRNYVLWQAAVQLMLVEEASPTSNSSLLMSQYAINVDRARRAYVDILAKAVYATSKSAQISWQDQAVESTRVY